LQTEAEDISADLAGEKPMWSLLPVLCCLSAGGQREPSIGVAAGWTLLYYAAHLLDSIEDGDDLGWFETLSEGVTTNLATGLIVSAFECVGKLRNLDMPGASVSDIEREFRKSIMVMSSGQHLDLSNEAPSLDECWHIAERKSATFFQLACRSGARCATSDERLIDAYGKFGYHVGMLVQIGDDWAGVWGDGLSGDDLYPELRITIPVAYAVAVDREFGLDQIRDRDDLVERIEKSGARLYLAAKLRWHEAEAARALQNACTRPKSLDVLAEFLSTIHMDLLS
jgi:geranylgeranyl pyrophosphate synthase